MVNDSNDALAWGILPLLYAAHGRPIARTGHDTHPLSLSQWRGGGGDASTNLQAWFSPSWQVNSWR
ncbi:hypothetical protein GCM10012280_70630 [Wenjunlia tyrosinilytica]|uniref:Uncharacterized protein n=1 Tax=Wenjunlia tyrosinilytica TaxID=1544741 RepID=A0A917ZY61_9ACTN|nr:hypothetical protein GCM10012280_70630 [Wenjunlia tyrosinilytica]